MRVLLIDDKPKYGGIASHNRLLIQGLKPRGVDFEVLATNPALYDDLGVPVRSVDLLNWDSCKRCYDALDLSSDSPYDLIHTHSTLFALGMLLACASPRLPILTTRHSALPSEREGRPHKEAYFLAGVVTAMGRQAHRRLLVVSPAVRDAYVKLGAEPSTMLTVPNAVADIYTEPAPTSSERLLFLGRLAPDKDPGLALAAVKEARELGHAIKLDFIGDGPLREALTTEIERSGLKGQVRLLGFQEDAARQLPRYLGLINSSPKEACCLTILEAMMQKRPVIATDCLGNRGLIEPEVQGLLHDGTPADLARKMIRLVSSPELQNDLGEAGRARYLEAFTPERFWDRHLEIYADLRSGK